jgi:hypothetical protein
MAEGRNRTTNTQTAVSNLTAEGNISFGDVNQFINNTYQSASAFIKRDNLEEYLEPYYPTLNDEEILISNLKSRKLLLIGGSHEDKPELALHIAARLVQQLSSKTDDRANSGSGNSVLELDCHSDPKIPLNEIYTGTVNEKDLDFPIFILSNLEPRSINFSIKKLLDATNSGRAYVIALTNAPKKSWNIEPSLDSLWFEPYENLYEPHSLVKSLSIKLDKISSEDERALKPGNQEYISEVAAHTLKTFADISRFARLISAQNSEVSHEEALEIALKAKDSRSSLKEWYQAIDDREKLLSIGLSLFDGLFEDQFFAALEQIVINVWQERDPSLRALDYYDLKNFGNHFRFEYDREYVFDLKKPKVLKLTEYAKKIRVLRSKIIRPSEKLTLIEIAWDNYRRQIFSALRVIVKLVENSVFESAESQKNWELYGDQFRRRKLREVLSETLGNLCLVAADTSGAVQGALHQLSTNKNFEVRNVAAKAIAYWYQAGYQQTKMSRLNVSEAVLGTLQRFYDDALCLEEALSPQNKQLKSYNHISLTKESEETEINPESSDPLEKAEKSRFGDVLARLNKFFRGEKPDNNSESYYIPETLKYVESRVGSSVSLAVGYVSRIDYSRNPNKEISRVLLLWLEELLESRLPLIHATLGYQTLSEVVPIYLNCPSTVNFLREAIQTHKDEALLNEGIALSISKAYAEPQERLEKNRSKVKELLDDWYQECQDKRPKKIDKNKNTYYDSLLKVIALVYGNIEYDNRSIIQVKESFDRLSEILEKGEKHPIVRHAVMSSVCNLTNSYFEQVHSQLRSLLFKMNIDEQDEVVKSLLKLHELQLEDIQEIGDIQLEQIYYKAWLVTGDEFLDDGEIQNLIEKLIVHEPSRLDPFIGKFKKIRLDGKEYRLCLSKERPLTAVQRVLFPWVKNEESPASQQVALRFFSSLKRN